MGKWREEANRQIAQFTTGERMIQANAMQLIAYWVQEMGQKKSERSWFPLVQKVLRKAPGFVDRGLFRGLVARDKFLQLFFSKDPKQPRVTEDVKAEVFDFVLASAKKLDREKPETLPPRFKKSDFGSAGLNLTIAAIEIMARTPKPKKKFNIGVLLLLAAIVASERS